MECDNSELKSDNVKLERIYCECHVADRLRIASHGVIEIPESDVSRTIDPDVVSLVPHIEAKDVRALTPF